MYTLMTTSLGGSLSGADSSTHTVFYKTPCGKSFKVATIFNLGSGVKNAIIVFQQDANCANAILEIAKLIEAEVAPDNDGA